MWHRAELQLRRGVNVRTGMRVDMGVCMDMFSDMHGAEPLVYNHVQIRHLICVSTSMELICRCVRAGIYV